MIGSHHTDAIARITDELVPLADKMLPTIRRRLVAKLSQFSDAIVENIRSDVQFALLLYGRAAPPVEVERAATIAVEVQARRGAELMVLLDRLRNDPRVSLTKFARALIDDMKPAFELHETKRLESDECATDQDLRTIVEADTAFRLLHYFLEAMKPILEDTQPRSMLGIRAGA